MRTIATTLFAAMLSLPMLAQPDVTNVHFANGSAVLDGTAMQQLDGLCAATKGRTPVSISVTGHTDSNGSDAYNLDLSQRRVEAVRMALADHCPSLEPVRIDRFGEGTPIADNSTHGGRAQNRRVAITIRYAECDQVQTDTYPADHHRHGAVRPLFPSADTPREHFRVDAGQPIEFIAKDGVRVRIAPEAIVDATGSTVTGPVDITYRSFHEPWAVIASGIPMHLGGPDAGHMESAGMFEVYATQKGQPLALKAGESITLSPPEPLRLEAGYRDWTLGADGRWEEQVDRKDSRAKDLQEIQQAAGPLSFRSNAMMAYASSDAATTTEASGTTEAVRRYMKNIGDLPVMPDTTHFLARIGSEAYCHTTECSPTTKPYAKYKGRYMTPYSDTDIPSIHLVIDRVNFRGRPETAFRVVMQRKALHTDWLAFPEKRMWVYNGPLSRKDLRKRFATKHFYQDVLLEASAGSSDGVLRVKDRGEWMDLPVDLSYYQQTAEDLEAWEGELRDYHGRFTAKRKRFDKKLDERVTSVVDRIRSGKRSAWKSARPAMTDAELAMNEQEWDEYARRSFNEDLWASIGTTQAAAEGFTQALVMRGFGIYNCDRILDRSAIEPAAVAVKDGDGAVFPWQMAYGVIEGRKAVITYWGNGGTEETPMRLSRDMSSILFVARDGRFLMVERPGEVAYGERLVLRGKPFEAPQSAKDMEAFTSK